MSTLIRPELSETNRYWIEKTPLLRIEAFLLTIPIMASCVQFVNRLSGFMAAISSAL